MTSVGEFGGDAPTGWHIAHRAAATMPSPTLPTTAITTCVNRRRTSFGRLRAEKAAEMLRWVLLLFCTGPPSSSRASAFCRYCRRAVPGGRQAGSGSNWVAGRRAVSGGRQAAASGVVVGDEASAAPPASSVRLQACRQGCPAAHSSSSSSQQAPQAQERALLDGLLAPNDRHPPLTTASAPHLQRQLRHVAPLEQAAQVVVSDGLHALPPVRLATPHAVVLHNRLRLAQLQAGQGTRQGWGRGGRPCLPAQQRKMPSPQGDGVGRELRGSCAARGAVRMDAGGWGCQAGATSALPHQSQRLLVLAPLHHLQAQVVVQLGHLLAVGCGREANAGAGARKQPGIRRAAAAAAVAQQRQQGGTVVARHRRSRHGGGGGGDGSAASSQPLGSGSAPLSRSGSVTGQRRSCHPSAGGHLWGLPHRATGPAAPPAGRPGRRRRPGWRVPRRGWSRAGPPPPAPPAPGSAPRCRQAGPPR